MFISAMEDGNKVPICCQSEGRNTELVFLRKMWLVTELHPKGWSRKPFASRKESQEANLQPNNATVSRGANQMLRIRKKIPDQCRISS